MRTLIDTNPKLLAQFDRFVLFSMLLILAGIQTAALIMQYVYGEIPCPLCLLQRYALFGCCFGIMIQLRTSASERGTGLSMIFAVLLLVISVRQTLLDLFPRPGHEYIGSAVFGVHMPVWSVFIAVILLFGFGLRFVLFGGSCNTEASDKSRSSSLFHRCIQLLIFYTLVLCAINFVSVVLQCGLGVCSTFGYSLLRN